MTHSYEFDYYSDDGDNFSDEFCSNEDNNPRFEPSLEDRINNAIAHDNVVEVSKLFETEVQQSEFQTMAYNALIHAASSASLNVCEYLLSLEGVDVNYAEDMYYPLMAACSPISKTTEHLSVRCVELFTKAGAYVNSTNAFNRSALMCACEKDLPLVVAKVLSYNNVEIDMADNTGWTALFYAVYGNNIDIVRQLLSAGAKVDRVDARGRRPFDIASEKGFDEIQQLVVPTVSDENEFCEAAIDDVFYDIRDPLSEIQNGFPYIIYSILETIRLQRYFPKIRESKMTLERFLLITNDELRRVGVCFDLHRRLILQAVKSFLLADWFRQDSFKFDVNDQPADLIEALNVQCKAALQIIVLNCTLHYIRSHTSIENPNVEDKRALQNGIKTCDIFFNFIKDDCVQISSRCDLIAEKYKLGQPADSCTDVFPVGAQKSYKWHSLIIVIMVIILSLLIHVALS